jgi:hypothetical protein
MGSMADFRANPVQSGTTKRKPSIDACEEPRENRVCETVFHRTPGGHATNRPVKPIISRPLARVKQKSIENRLGCQVAEPFGFSASVGHATVLADATFHIGQVSYTPLLYSSRLPFTTRRPDFWLVCHGIQPPADFKMNLERAGHVGVY